MKRKVSIGIMVIGLGGIAFFFWQAHAAQSFKKEFYRTAEQDRRALFERYYRKLSAHQIASVIESTTATCHSQAHDLGKVVYAHTKDIGESFRQCGKSCTDGCFHGVLMEALGTENTIGIDGEQHIKIEDLTNKVNDICATASDHRSGNCAHGIGHAFTYLADYHPEIALPLCQAFPTVPLQFYCSGGAYMELDSGGYELSCDETLPYTTACWTYKTRSFIKDTNSFDEASAKCLTLTGLARRGCFRGIGFVNIGIVESHPELLPSICNAGSDDDKIVCIEGAIEKLADAHESRAIAACTHFSEPLRAECNRAARDKLYSLDKPFERYLKAE